MGALAAALGTMVANLSSHKPGWDERWEEFGNQAEEGQQHLKTLLALVDEDTAAFNRIMDAFKMPKGTEAEKAERSAAIQAATLYATEVPLRGPIHLDTHIIPYFPYPGNGGLSQFFTTLFGYSAQFFLGLPDGRNLWTDVFFCCIFMAEMLI